MIFIHHFLDAIFLEKLNLQFHKPSCTFNTVIVALVLSISVILLLECKHLQEKICAERHVEFELAADLCKPPPPPF